MRIECIGHITASVSKQCTWKNHAENHMFKMADFSSRDIEKLIEIWEEEEDLWNISRENYH